MGCWGCGTGRWLGWDCWVAGIVCGRRRQGCGRTVALSPGRLPGRQLRLEGAARAPVHSQQQHTTDTAGLAPSGCPLPSRLTLCLPPSSITPLSTLRPRRSVRSPSCQSGFAVCTWVAGKASGGPRSNLAGPSSTAASHAPQATTCPSIHTAAARLFHARLAAVGLHRAVPGRCGTLLPSLNGDRGGML